MDKAEAKMIVEKDLEFYRELAYEEIAGKVGESESFERRKEKGEPYQIEFNFFYDDNVSGNIRVMGTVSYSGWTDFFPVSNDFIVAPEGQFIGE